MVLLTAKYTLKFIRLTQKFMLDRFVMIIDSSGDNCRSQRIVNGWRSEISETNLIRLIRTIWDKFTED